MYEAHQLGRLIHKAEESIKELLSAENSIMYIANHENRTLYTLKGDEQSEPYPIDTGIIGEVIKKHKAIEVLETYADPNFNSKVDLDTNLPTLTLPVFGRNKDKVIGVIQVYNTKNHSTHINSNNDYFDVEILNKFTENVGICLGKFMKEKTLLNERTRNSLMLAFYRAKEKATASSKN
jgi:hypothetical protein